MPVVACPPIPSPSYSLVNFSFLFDPIYPTLRNALRPTDTIDCAHDCTDKNGAPATVAATINVLLNCAREGRRSDDVVGG